MKRERSHDKKTAAQIDPKSNFTHLLPNFLFVSGGGIGNSGTGESSL